MAVRVTVRFPGDVDIPLPGDMSREAFAWAWHDGERPRWMPLDLAITDTQIDHTGEAWIRLVRVS